MGFESFLLKVAEALRHFHSFQKQTEHLRLNQGASKRRISVSRLAADDNHVNELQKCETFTYFVGVL